MIDVYQIKEEFINQFTHVRVERESNCLYYTKLVSVPTQTQAEKTRKLRDIEIDQTLGNISDQEYMERKSSVERISVEENDSYPVLANHYFNRKLDLKTINFSISPELEYMQDTNDFLQRDLYRHIYQDFQKTLSNLQTKTIHSMDEYNREIFEHRILHHSGLLEYCGREEIDGRVFTLSNLLRPDQVLVTPMGIYFDVDEVYINHGANLYPEFRMLYYLDVIDKEDSILFNLRF